MASSESIEVGSNKIRLAATVGAANAQDFLTVSDQGQVLDPSHSIVPIFVQTAPGNLDLVGTGFFITTTGLLATAAHVAEEIRERKLPAAIIQITPENSYVERELLRCFVHNDADVAICQLRDMRHTKTGLPLANRIAKLKCDIPPVGERVCTYAYPNTVTEAPAAAGAKGKVYLNPSFYAGQVEEVHPNGRDRVLMPAPCFQTTMHVHGGASGGPVFDSTGHVVGVNSTSLNVATDVSFVTSIAQLLEIEIPDVEILSAPAATYSVAQLAALGHVSAK